MCTPLFPVSWRARSWPLTTSENRAAEELKDCVALLRAWNGQMEKQTPAPLLMSLVYQQLRKMVADRAAPGKADLYNPQMAPAVLEKILEGDGERLVSG